MQTRPQIARNTAYFTGALLIQKLLSFIYFYFLSSELAKSSLGEYVYALSFTTLFSIIVDLGFTPLLTREAAKDGSQINKLLNTVLSIKLPLAGVAILLMIVTVHLLHPAVAIANLIYLAIILMLLDSVTLSLYAVLRARHNLKYESLGTLGFQFINFSLGMYFLFTTHNPFYLIVALIVASAFNLVVALTTAMRSIGYRPQWMWDRPTQKQLIGLLPAFTLSGIFIKIYNSADSVLLGMLAGSVAVAHFAVPAKVIFALQGIVPGAFAATIFPAMSHYYAQQRQDLEQVFQRAVIYLLATAVPMTVGLYVLTPYFLRVVWPSYMEVVPTFRLMSLALPFIFLAFATGNVLNAADQQRRNTRNRGVVTLLGILLNLALIPWWSHVGAAMAFLITNVVLLWMDWQSVGVALGFSWQKLWPVTYKIVIAGVIMGLIVWWLAFFWNVLIVVIIGAAAYAGLLWWLGVIRPQDIMDIRRPRTI